MGPRSAQADVEERVLLTPLLVHDEYDSVSLKSFEAVNGLRDDAGLSSPDKSVRSEAPLPEHIDHVAARREHDNLLGTKALHYKKPMKGPLQSIADAAEAFYDVEDGIRPGRPEGPGRRASVDRSNLGRDGVGVAAVDGQLVAEPFERG